MPELPEVETVRRGLAAHLIGLSVVNIFVNLPKVFRGNTKALIDGKVVSVRRLSKLLLLDLDTNYSLAVHLKMTGRLIVDDTTNLKFRKHWEFDYYTHKHTHARIDFTKGKSLLFHDVRQFGYLESMPTKNVKTLPYIKTLGKEFLSTLSRKDFQQVLATSNRMIKVVLLDQTKVAGVGNIYANEALFLAKIHPESIAYKIPEPAVNKLFDALEHVMKKAIESGGASSNDFRNVYGKKGLAQKNLFVYGRVNLSCNNCNSLIKKQTIGGRGSYFCLQCQQISL